MEWLELLKLISNQENQTQTQQQIAALAKHVDKLDGEMTEIFDAFNALSSRFDETRIFLLVVCFTMLFLTILVGYIAWSYDKKIKALESKLADVGS